MDKQFKEVDPLTKRIMEDNDVPPIVKVVVAHMKALGVETYDEATLGMLVEFVTRYVVETGEAAGEVAGMMGRNEVVPADIRIALRSAQRPKPTEESMKDYARMRNALQLETFPKAGANNFTCQTTSNGFSAEKSYKPKQGVTMMKK